MKSTFPTFSVFATALAIPLAISTPALAAGDTYASDPSSPGTPSTHATSGINASTPIQSGAESGASVEGGGALTAAALENQTVYDRADVKVAMIDAVRTDVNGKRTAILTIGELFGMGGRHVEVPVQHFSRADGRIVVDLSEDELKRMPDAGSGQAAAMSD